MRICFYRASPPKLPKIAKRAKKRATGKIPITVNAMFFAFSHSAFPDELTAGQDMASETSLKISMPMSKATAAPMKDKINPRLSTIDRLNRSGYLRY